MMIITLLLSLMPMAGLFLMLLSGVGFIQDTKFFSSAPGEVRNVVKPRVERFKGAHAIGWIMAVFSVLLMIGAFIIGAWNGIHSGFGFRQFFIRFIVMILLLKAFDILFFDWVLLCNAGFNFFPHFYPETKDVLGHYLFGYNWKTHLAHIIGGFIIAAVLAWVCTLFS